MSVTSRPVESHGLPALRRIRLLCHKQEDTTPSTGTINL